MSSLDLQPLPPLSVRLLYEGIAPTLCYSISSILVFLLFRGKLTKHANHGMCQDAVYRPLPPTLLVTHARLACSLPYTQAMPYNVLLHKAIEKIKSFWLILF